VNADVPRFPTLNGVRAVAALAVLTTHVSFQTGTTGRGGMAGSVGSRLDFGVALFFVLSGFLLSRGFLARLAAGRPAPSVRNYLWKRALRILPVYWLAVVAAMLLFEENSDTTAVDWLRQLTLTQAYPGGHQVNGLTQMWSLSVEVAFYVLLPGLMAVLAKAVGWRPRRLLLVLGALGLVTPAWLAAVRVWVSPQWADQVSLWLPGFLSWFCAGMALAVVNIQCERQPEKRRTKHLVRVAEATGSWWIGGLALFATASTAVAGPILLEPPTAWEAVAKNLLYAAAATCFVFPLVVGDRRPGPVERPLASAVMNYLGEISYVAFCVHLTVLHLVYTQLTVPPFGGQFGMVWLSTLVGTIAVSALVHRYLEVPLRRFRSVGDRASRATYAVSS
jgi:peptidoglycan/LPS O-acetylase OafA/YrhL